MPRETMSSLRLQIAALQTQMAGLTKPDAKPKKTPQVSVRCAGYGDKICYEKVMTDTPQAAKIGTSNCNDDACHDGDCPNNDDDDDDCDCRCHRTREADAADLAQPGAEADKPRCSSCLAAFVQIEELKLLVPTEEDTERLLTLVDEIHSLYTSGHFGRPQDRFRALSTEGGEDEQRDCSKDPTLVQLFEFKKGALRVVMEKRGEQTMARATTMLYDAWLTKDPTFPASLTPIRVATWLIDRDKTFSLEFARMEQFGDCLEEKLKQIGLRVNKRRLRHAIDAKKASNLAAQEQAPTPTKPLRGTAVKQLTDKGTAQA